MPLSENQARQNLEKLLQDFEKLTPEERKQMSESGVVSQFIRRLLGDVLGWPTDDPTRYKYELHTDAGRPDITLELPNGEKVYVEAKRLGVIFELPQARFTTAGVFGPDQLPSPGMTTDRTREEQQAINYAFETGNTWAILTNFEKLRLFNARRDWLVLSFERPRAYLTDFDRLWQLAYPNLLKGSLSALSSERYARDIDSQYLDFINIWRERLALDIIHNSDVNPWAFNSDASINLPLLRAVVQRFIDRLVIVRFAEDRIVIPPGTLRQFYELRQTNPYSHTMEEFLEKFFSRFDQDHNSALFARGAVDEAFFSDDVLLPLIDKLYEVRYRAMPADIIGNTYEQYLGKTLVQRDGSVMTADNLETRKKQGSYYTPQVIVRYLVDNSLGRYLYSTENGRPDGDPIPGETRKTSSDVHDLRVLDSACGSGSFLIYAYEVLADFYESELKRLESEYQAQVRDLAANFDRVTLDDRLRAQRLEDEIKRLRDYPRLILETHLYGVDLDPQAAEIAVVNLMMRAMERRSNQKRLPLILNQNVKVGNSLVGLRPDDERLHAYREEIADLIRLRRALTTDPDQLTPDEYERRHLERIEELTRNIPDPVARKDLARYYKPRRVLEMRDTHPTYTGLQDRTDALRETLNAELAPHFGDLERVRPFHWGIEFPEAFYDAQGKPLDNPGFTIVVGNPPWEIVMPEIREFYAQFDPRIESQLNRQQVEARIAELEAENPRIRADWEAQERAFQESAAYFTSSPDYTRRGRGHTATHKLFLERMYAHLLTHEGRIGYVVPSGIYTDLGTKDLRKMLLDEGNVQYIFSFSNERSFFTGVHHDFKFALVGAQKGPQSDGFWAAFRFNPRVAVKPDDLPTFLANESNLIYVRRESLERFSPDSLSLMEFETLRDYQIAENIYNDWPHLGQELEGLWNPKFAQEINLTSDRHLFNTKRHGLPMYEGKMIHQFDAFFSEPQYWMDESEGYKRVKSKTGLDYQRPRLAFRDISNATNERTLIAAILPPYTFAGNTAIVETCTQGKAMLFLLGILNSFCADYIIRRKVSKHVNMFYLYQLPVPRLTPGDPYFDAIVARAARLVCVRDEFAGLWAAVMGETPPPGPLPVHGEGEKDASAGSWGQGASVPGPLAEDERQRLRDETDALVAHLYGLSRDEFDHILGTFPLVFPETDAGWARREALLATYDALSEKK